jgi:hypothetical protein
MLLIRAWLWVSVLLSWVAIEAVSAETSVLCAAWSWVALVCA